MYTTNNFDHKRSVAWFKIVRQNIYLTYVIFFSAVQLILHLILSHFSLGLIICCPLLIHIPHIFQSGKLIRSNWNFP